MSDGYEYMLESTFVVVDTTHQRVFGPFADELSAVAWGKAQGWPIGWFIRKISNPNRD